MGHHKMSNNKFTGVVAKSDETQPIALIYRGKVGCCHACSEALKTLLESVTRWNFDVKYVSTNGELSVKEGLKISDVVLYAQPGGNGSLKDAFDK